MKPKNIGRKCKLYKKLQDNFIQCLCCFHKCIIAPGPSKFDDPNKQDPQSFLGICCVRHNFEGILYHLDSKPSTICVDHIEKQPFFHFYPGERVFVVGTVGCNMRCSFCQNWRVSQLPQNAIKKKKRSSGSSSGKSYLKDIEDSILPAYELSPLETVMEAKRRHCRIIEYNGYNEPTVMFDDFVQKTAKIAKSFGMKNIMCSNGYQSIESIEMIASYIDAISIGLKSIRNSFYSKFCGARIKPILRNIKKISSEHPHIFLEIQTLVIPGINDSNEDIHDLCTFLFSINPQIILHLSRFEKEYKFLENQPNVPRETSDEDLLRCYLVAKKSGLKNVYVDIEKKEFFQTICEGCGNILVERNVFIANGTKIVGIKEGESSCNNCGKEIFGVWSDSTKQQTYSIQEKEEDISSLSRINDDDDDEILILFGSQTGVSEEIAHQMKKIGDLYIKEKELEDWNIKVVDLEDLNEKEFLFCFNKFVVIIISTYFHGHPPINAKRFYDHIINNTSDGGNIEMRYAVFGVGSTGNLECHKDTYQVVARRLDQKLGELGALRIQKLVEWNKKQNFQSSVSNDIQNFWDLFFSKKKVIK